MSLSAFGWCNLLKLSLLGAHVAADTERWAKVIRDAGIKLE